MKFTPTQKNLVFAVNQGLYPIAVLASRYDVTFNTVKNLVNQYKSFTKCKPEERTVKEPDIGLTTEQKNCLVTDFNNGFSYSDLEKRYKLTGSQLRFFLNYRKRYCMPDEVPVIRNDRLKARESIGTEKERQQIRQDCSAKMPLDRICKKYQISKAILNEILKGD